MAESNFCGSCKYCPGKGLITPRPCKKPGNNKKVTDLDSACFFYAEPKEQIEKKSGNDRTDSQASALIKYVESEDIELFHDETHDPYARIRLDGHTVNLSTKERGLYQNGYTNQKRRIKNMIETWTKKEYEAQKKKNEADEKYLMWLNEERMED
jgi:hypothetical protein